MNIVGNVGVYRRIPLAVEAIQWTDNNTAKVRDFLGGENPFNVPTLYKGDYVVKEADGQNYVFSKEIFEALYFPIHVSVKE